MSATQSASGGHASRAPSGSGSGPAAGSPLGAPLLARLSVDEIQQALRAANYICDRPLAMVLFLSVRLGKPLFLEGEAGVGKTEVGKVLAEVLETRLIRLQCYEGLDASAALYEWNYPKQILRIKMEEVSHGSREAVQAEIFSPDYLIRRPLLEAIQSGPPAPVLLIDEIDRADEEFEAFLLEVLSDFQITIPELGTLRAVERPAVVLTSNRTREIHDALKRRCLYHWIEYPTLEKELEILAARIPGIRERLARQICRFMQAVRDVHFQKKPGVAETLDWAAALLALNGEELDAATLEETLGCVFKNREDLHKARAMIANRQIDIEALFREVPG